MGFRSTLTTNHYGADLPDWFKEKYKDCLNFPSGTLVSSTEFKLHSGNGFFYDYQQALIENGLLEGEFEVRFAVLAEDGIITKVIIRPAGIIYCLLIITHDAVDGVWNGG